VLTFAFIPFLQLNDPAPNIVRSRDRARNLVCVRVEPLQGAVEYPGRIQPPRPRGDDADRSTLVCRERLLRRGLRAPRDEAVLNTLEDRAQDVALRVSSLDPALRDRTWLVETFYDHPEVLDKISFATQNALMAQGLSVSDRHPKVAPGDVEVLTRLDPMEAYPAACARYQATGSVSGTDALLALVALDRRATELQAGLCVDGRWTWLP